MIVGTPLLYHVVIIRSKAQAQALQRTLRKNKDLGNLIKKLRVEGGFGDAMRTILTSSPNIKDISLSIDLRSSDSVKGLLNALPTINPTHLAILDNLHKDTKTNAPVRQLSKKIMECFKTWTNLVSRGFGCSKKRSI